jgi:hypothetical protein
MAERFAALIQKMDDFSMKVKLEHSVNHEVHTQRCEQAELAIHQFATNLAPFNSNRYLHFEMPKH